jgi:S1-C subfamily serine protease
LRRVVRYFELPSDSGVLIASVEPDSPAALSGLRDGDIIVRFDEQPIASIDQLHRLLTEEEVGRPHVIGLLRGRERLTRTVTPIEAKR